MLYFKDDDGACNAGLAEVQQAACGKGKYLQPVALYQQEPKRLKQ